MAAWKKVFSDFWTNKTRTLLMILTITLGVFSVGFVGNVGSTMKREMDADFHSAHPHDAIIYAGPFDEDWVRALRKIPGVGDVEGRTQVTAQLVKSDGAKVGIFFDVVKSYRSIHLDLLKPADPSNGSLPALSRREVALDRSAQTLGFQPGDVLTIELPDGQTRQLYFRGYVHDVSAIPYSMQGAVSAYVDPDTGTYLGASPDYNKLLLAVSEDETDFAHVSSIAQIIGDRFKKNGVTVSSISVYNPGHHFAWQVTQGVIFILSALGWLTVLLSVLLIVNTIVALMSQHIRQIGIMKAIGGGTLQIFSMYVALILAFGCVALAISIPLSGWAAHAVGLFLANFLNYDPGRFTLDVPTVLTQVALAFAVPLVAGIIPMITTLRLPVREALSSYGIGNVSGKKSALAESHLAFVARPLLVSLRNMVRRKARLSLTLLALVLGGAIFIAVFNLWLAFDKSMESVQGYFLADINLSFTRSYHFEDVKSIAMKVPGVADVEGWLTASGQVLSADGKSSDEILFVAPPSNSSLIRPVLTAGRWLTPLDTNAVVIGNHLQKIRPDLRVGDWITIKIGNDQTRWQIVGFYRLIGNTNPPLLYTNYEILSRVLKLPHRVFELRVITYDHDAPSQIAISQALQDVFKARNIPVASVQQGAVWMQQQKSQTDLLVYFMLGMAVLIAGVGGLGLTGMMSINVMERTREIGVMRAIGASNGNIQSIVILEGMAVGLVSWIAAVILSVPLTYVLDSGVGVALMQSPMPAVFNWNGSFFWLVGILVIAALASAIPAGRASRLTVRDTLVYE
ncbi:MAG TPA: FtsX-like permease family protein [Anaerolineales bacterium]|nr:FtsX-like permease family protein [Anaerolineales bacterium]